jgi:hypothetical protein
MSTWYVAVADLDAPVELNILSGAIANDELIATSGSEYTTYQWNTTQFTENSPYIVDGVGGSWVAIFGKYINTITTTTVSTVSVANLGSPVELDSVSATNEGTALIASCGGEYTIYNWHTVQLTQSIPYIVNGNGGSWVASGGKYVNASAGIRYTMQSLTGGSCILAGSTVGMEVIALTSSGATDITHITGADAGAIKILTFDDDYFTIKHDSGTPKIILQGGVDATFSSGDVLLLLNRGGSQPSTNGYWREIWRSLYS